LRESVADPAELKRALFPAPFVIRTLMRPLTTLAATMPASLEAVMQSTIELVRMGTLQDIGTIVFI
jgi:hypothetical protein